jgi:hypothetical protein
VREAQHLKLGSLCTLYACALFILGYRASTTELSFEKKFGFFLWGHKNILVGVNRFSSQRSGDEKCLGQTELFAVDSDESTVIQVAV